MNAENTKEKIGGIAASAMWFLYATGVLAVLISILAAVQVDFVGAGVCLAAAGVAHGLLLNALIRR